MVPWNSLDHYYFSKNSVLLFPHANQDTQYLIKAQIGLYMHQGTLDYIIE